MESGDFCQPSQHINGRKGGGYSFQPMSLFSQSRAELNKRFLLSGKKLRISSDDTFFKVLQLGSHEPFGIDERLLAGVVSRHTVKIGLCNLDIVSIDLIVANLQRFNAGSFPFTNLEGSNPPFAFFTHLAQLVNVRIESFFDDISITN